MTPGSSHEANHDTIFDQLNEGDTNEAEDAEEESEEEEAVVEVKVGCHHFREAYLTYSSDTSHRRKRRNPRKRRLASWSPQISPPVR